MTTEKKEAIKKTKIFIYSSKKNKLVPIEKSLFIEAYKKISEYYFYFFKFSFDITD